MTTLRLALAPISRSFPAPAVIQRTSRAISIALALCLPALAVPTVAGASITIDFDSYPGGAVHSVPRITPTPIP